MNRIESLRCYRCGGRMEQTATADSLHVVGEEVIVRYDCSLCGQQYEVQFVSTAVFAVSSNGEAFALLNQCPHCGQLYPADTGVPHSCAVVVDEELLETPLSEEKKSSPLGEAARVHLYVLGQFRLEYRNEQQQWQPVIGTSLQHQRVRALLHCLVSSPGRTLGRKQAIDMLWPDLDIEAASVRLDKDVYNLRRLFEPGRSRPATSNVLLTEHATLMLADQSQLWVDADAFEALLSQARASDDPGQTEQLLKEAALLYGGDYLSEERVIPWVQARRESLRRSWIGLLLELADLRITREALSSAINTLDRLLAVDPANEAAVQRLIPLFAQSGRRAEALRIYQRFADVLKQEYNIAPLPETRALYKAL